VLRFGCDIAIETTMATDLQSLDGVIRDGRHLQPVRVYYEDTDFSGIVYHANYLRFMERGRTNYLRLLGTDQRALFEEARKEAPGFAFVVRSMSIEFLAPARMSFLSAPSLSARATMSSRSFMNRALIVM